MTVAGLRINTTAGTTRCRTGAHFATRTTVCVVVAESLASTVATGLTTTTDLAATTAVPSVVENIDTGAGTVGLTAWTTRQLTGPVLTGLTAGARFSTGTTVAVVSLGIHTSTTTKAKA